MDFNQIKIGMTVIGKNFGGELSILNDIHGKVRIIKEHSIGIEFDIVFKHGHTLDRLLKRNSGRLFFEKGNEAFSDIGNNLEFITLDSMIEKLQKYL